MYYISEDPKSWAESTPNVWIKLPSLLKEVLGYTDEDIQIFKDFDTNNDIGALTFAINLTKEQAVLIQQPFVDNDISVCCLEYDDITKKLIDFVSDSQLGITKQPPKDHYYDKPVISPEQRINPRTDPYYDPAVHNSPFIKSTPTVTCPYCKSTNCKKISALSKAGSVFVWGIFALGKTTKQWHCNNCNSDF